MITPIDTKLKCFKKKQYEFVFNLFDAIIEVDAREKKRPNKKNIQIKKKIDLSIFFHQSQSVSKYSFISLVSIFQLIY